MAQFNIPDFIKKSDVNTIHKRMRDNLPNDIDSSEGSHPWNFTYTTAYEHAYFVQFCLLNAIKLIWPEFSYGIYSDYHGECRGMQRHKEKYATGYIDIVGRTGTIIPEGTIFSTEKIGNNAITEFETTSNAVIGEETTVKIPIAAVIAGKSGNVLANTITVNRDKISGISSVTNSSATTGGFDAENDDSFNERIKEYDQTQDNSFIGNDNDYRRWAMSGVDGVGEAIIIDPEDNPDVEDDSGIITIILIDANGEPASETLCAAVYNYIMCPTPLSTNGKKTDGEKTGIERLAPSGVNLVVEPPKTMVVTVSALVELNGISDIDVIKSNYVASLQTYLLEAIQDGEIRYSKVMSILASTTGVADCKNIKINNGTTNIQLNSQQIPIINSSSVILTEGQVDG